MSLPVRFRIKGTNVYVDPVGSTAYQAASNSPRMVRWRPPHGGPNTLLSGALPTLRGRSRDAVRKDGTADTAIEAIVTNIIGAGIKPQFGTADSALNKALAELWSDWADEADADGALDFYGLQALAVRSMAEGGEVFGRLRIRRPSDGLAVPLQVQLLESEYCPNEKNEQAKNGNWIRCGVEFDAIGRRVSYHLFRQHPFDELINGFTDLFPIPVPAAEVLHLRTPRRPGMIRGEPWLTRALVKLHDLDKYDDAQLVRQQIAALFTGFVTTKVEEGDDSGVIFEGQETSADDDGLALASLEPGTMQMLEPGQEVDWSKPPEPGDSYEAFMRVQQRSVAASAGILYEQVTGDYSQGNDRTWRAAVNEFRRRCAMWQHHLVAFQYCRPILVRWVALGVLAGKIRLPAGIDARTIVRTTKWVPEGWAYINPQQDVAAKRSEVRSGFRSRAEVVSERGYDVEQVDAEMAADNERADELGLVLDSDARRTSNAGLTQARPGGSEYPDLEADEGDDAEGSGNREKKAS